MKELEKTTVENFLYDYDVMENFLYDDDDVMENRFFYVDHLLLLLFVVMVNEHERMKMVEFSNGDDDVIEVDRSVLMMKELEEKTTAEKFLNDDNNVIENLSFDVGHLLLLLFVVVVTMDFFEKYLMYHFPEI